MGSCKHETALSVSVAVVSIVIDGPLCELPVVAGVKGWTHDLWSERIGANGGGGRLDRCGVASSPPVVSVGCRLAFRGGDRFHAVLGSMMPPKLEFERWGRLLQTRHAVGVAVGFRYRGVESRLF